MEIIRFIPSSNGEERLEFKGKRQTVDQRRMENIERQAYLETTSLHNLECIQKENEHFEFRHNIWKSRLLHQGAHGQPWFDRLQQHRR